MLAIYSSPNGVRLFYNVVLRQYHSVYPGEVFKALHHEAENGIHYNRAPVKTLLREICKKGGIKVLETKALRTFDERGVFSYTLKDGSVIVKQGSNDPVVGSFCNIISYD